MCSQQNKFGMEPVNSERSSRSNEKQNYSEDRYRALFELAPYPVVIVGLLERQVIFINDRAQKAMGISQLEALGTSIDNFFVNSSDCEKVMSVLADNKQLTDYEVQCTDIRGSRFWALLSATRVPYEGLDAAFISFNQINLIKEYEESLKESFNQQFLINEILTMLYQPQNWDFAIQGAIKKIGTHIGVHRVRIFCDAPDGDSARCIYEWCAKGTEELISKMPDLSYLDVPSHKRLLSMYGKICTSELESIPDDLHNYYFEQLKIKSALVFPLSAGEIMCGFIGFDDCKFGRIWSSGEIQALRAVASVISATFVRKNAEEALMLEKKRAEEANGAKSIFLANMSHEIRTPLNAIIGFMDLLEGASLDPVQKDFVREARHASEALLFIINDILDFSKVEAGHMELENIDFNVRHAIEEAVVMNAHRAQEKKLNLFTMIHSNVPEYLKGDPGRLKQIINNLTANAVKFTNFGEVTIMAEGTEVGDGSTLLRVSVTDTGIGIPQNALKHLFDPFIQADNSTTRRFGGTGLGLTICKTLTDAMGGTLEVESKVGKGTCFTFTVVLGQSDKKTAGAPGIEARSLRGKRILIVDGNATSRKVMDEYLRSVGADTVPAENAVAAIARIMDSTHTSFDSAIIDSSVPDMDVFVLANTIKSMERTRNLPLVMLTSIAQKGDSLAAHKEGFSGFLTKPVRYDELISCMAMIGENQFIEAGSSRLLVTRHTVKESTYHKQLKILLVEDNLINQKVFVNLLKSEGLSCDIANDGYEGVLACETHTYDVVFMDCQMPVMDGYSATTNIKNNAAIDKKPVIIALTAHALKGEREKCFASGMDDYLSKPVTHEDILNVLNRHFGEIPAQAVSQAADEAVAETAAVVITGESGRDVDSSLPNVADAAVTKNISISRDHLAQLISDERLGEGYPFPELMNEKVSDVIKMLMDEAYFSKEGASEIISDFIKRIYAALPAIESHMENHEIQPLKTELHALKGAAGSLFMKCLHKLLQDFENAVIEDRSHQWSTYLTMVQNIAGYYFDEIDMLNES